MNVSATGGQDYIAQTRMCDFDPVAASPGNEGQDGAQPMPRSTAGSLFAIQKQFGALIRDLAQKLSSLERQLMQALRELTASSAAAQGCDGAPPVQGGYPPFHRYGKIVTEASRRHEVDPLLVNAVIDQESGFRADAVSKAGALGLMQLMPGTARSLGVSDALDPRQNVEGGTTLLRQLLDRYHGQVDLALAAYNAGPEAVDKYGGIPPFPETQAYVRNVMESYRVSALSAS